MHTSPLDLKKAYARSSTAKRSAPWSFLRSLTRIGGRNGIGIADICENRMVGIKSRGIYETPGGTILLYAHRELEYLTLDRKTQAFNEVASNKFTELVYNGEWYTPLREALSAYFDKVNETTTGTVKLKLYKGNIIPAGATSPYSLYNESIASFTTGDLYNHKDATGFINLFGLPEQGSRYGDAERREKQQAITTINKFSVEKVLRDFFGFKNNFL